MDVSTLYLKHLPASHTGTHPGMCFYLLPAPALGDSCTDRSFASGSRRGCIPRCWRDNLQSLQRTRNKESSENAKLVPVSLSQFRVSYTSAVASVLLQNASSSTLTTPRTLGVHTRLGTAAILFITLIYIWTQETQSTARYYHQMSLVLIHWAADGWSLSLPGNTFSFFIDDGR